MKKAPAPSNLEAFIAGFPPDVQAILRKLRDVVRKAAPEADEAIKYGIPTLVLQGKNLVHFSAYAKHVGFYPSPSVLEAFRDELEGYVGGRGSVQFPLDRPMPYPLIARMVRFRVAQVVGPPARASGAAKPATRKGTAKSKAGSKPGRQRGQAGAGRTRS